MDYKKNIRLHDLTCTFRETVIAHTCFVGNRVCTISHIFVVGEILDTNTAKLAMGIEGLYNIATIF